VLSPSDGTVGEIAVTLVEWIIRRRRIKVAPWQQYPRIATLLGELPNTALPKNPAVLRSSVGSGVSICATAALVVWHGISVTYL